MTNARVALARGLGLAGPLILGLAVAPASARSKDVLPPIKLAAGNAVASCATPGRLMAFTRDRNSDLDARFATIAVDYMRHGTALGVRWDFAYFQMLLETGNLSYRRGNRQGDVKIKQNNFAGIGATGGGVPGESFPDVSTGVKAHLEHLRLYAGDPVENPVAERTRKVAEWGVLTSWQKGMTRPVTFRDLASRWASNASYARDIQSIADSFFEDHCEKPDPAPDLVAQAGGKAPAPETSKAAEAEDEDKPSGKTLAKRDAERGRKEGRRREALGAAALARRQQQADTAPDPDAAEPAAPPAETATVAAVQKPQQPGLKLLNPPADEPSSEDQAPASRSPEPPAPSKTKAVAPEPPSVMAPPATPPLAGQPTGKCRVWTASYGGQKAIIIKSTTDQTTNFTVLDVNEGKEKREAEAYIKAYAKGGEVVSEFASQAAALDKAFQLCPEG